MFISSITLVLRVEIIVFLSNQELIKIQTILIKRNLCFLGRTDIIICYLESNTERKIFVFLTEKKTAEPYSVSAYF